MIAALFGPAIVRSASYGFDIKGVYGNDKTSIIPGYNYYLLGLLNSTLMDFYLKQFASTKQNGYYEYKPVYVSQLPILDASEKIVDAMTELVDKILANGGSSESTYLFEQQIDAMIYEAYGLTAEEVEMVDGL